MGDIGGKMEYKQNILHEVPTSEASFKHNDISILMEELGKSGRKLYAFTIKNIKKDTFISESEVIRVMTLMEACHKGSIHDFTLEKDSLQRFHAHGIMEARKHLKYTLFKRPYWHIYITPLNSCEDVRQYSKYIHKDDTQKIVDYFTNGENHFIEGVAA